MFDRPKVIAEVKRTLEAQAPRRYLRLIERGKLQRFAEERADEAIDVAANMLVDNPLIAEGTALYTVLSALNFPDW
jgi:hypothetical protein